jgi:hypothetical protein
MLRDVEYQIGVGRRPVMRVLLPPARTEDPRGLPDDTGDLPPKRLVVVVLGTNFRYADVSAEVNGVAAAPVRPSQRHLQGNLAVSEEYAGQARARVREGEFSSAPQRIGNQSDRASELVGNLHRVGFGTEFLWQHITQLELDCMTHAGQRGDLSETRQLRRDLSSQPALKGSVPQPKPGRGGIHRDAMTVKRSLDLPPPRRPAPVLFRFQSVLSTTVVHTNILPESS